MKNYFFYLSLLAVIFGSLACKRVKEHSQQQDTLAVNDSTGIRLELVTDALSSPIQLCVPPDDTHRKFITDRAGKIWIIKNGSLLPHPFLDVGAKPGEKKKSAVLGTINSMAFHPRFATNHKFYLCYNAATSIEANQTKLVVSEFTTSDTNPNAVDPSTERRVLEVEGGNMFADGSGMAFGPDGYLYISIGDNPSGVPGYKYLAQDLNCLSGKLLRIDVDKIPYGIPPDNPFVGVPNKKPEIWAYGFRRLWRFSFDQQTQRLFGADVGQNKQEEIDDIVKGANYGWPYMEGDSIFKKGSWPGKTAYMPPINAYTHQEGICVIGGYFYHGKGIPFLQGKFVFGDYNGNMFALSRHESGQWERQKLNIGNKPAEPFLICDFDVDENNELYVMGLLNTKTSQKGAIYKIVQ